MFKKYDVQYCTYILYFDASTKEHRKRFVRAASEQKNLNKCFLTFCWAYTVQYILQKNLTREGKHRSDPAPGYRIRPDPDLQYTVFH
jgi:hypothetical protein